MNGAGNRLKAATGMAMSALGRVFAPGGGERCEKHGVRLRRMVPRNCYWKNSLCPVCERRTVTMRAYPFNLYFSACGLIWTAAILAVVFGVVPQVRTAFRNHAEYKASAEAAEAEALAETMGGMPQEWASLYRMLEKVHYQSRSEAFMEYATGSREFKAGERSPIIVSLPRLNQDGGALFMGLFWWCERDYVMPVLAKLSAGPQDTP